MPRPNFDYPYKRTTVLPELSDIVKAMELAELKDERWRDPRRLFAVLRRLPVADERLNGHVGAVKAALVTTQWDLVPRDESTRDITTLAKKRLKRSINLLRWEHVQKRLFGKFAAKHIWTLSDWTTPGGQSIKLYAPRTAVLDQCDYEINENYSHNIALFKHSATGSLVREDVGNSTNELSYTSDEWASENAGGVMRSIVFGLWLLYTNIQDWHEFGQLAQGLVVATYKNRGIDLNADAKVKAETALRQISKTKWAAVPDNISFDFKSLIDAAAGMNYKEFKTAKQDDIAIAIRGAANTTALGTVGSYAAIETQLYGVEEATGLMDREALAAHINEQLIPQDVARNYNETGEVMPYEFEWRPRYAEDSEKESRTVTNLLKVGCELDKAEVSKKTGYTILNPDKTLKLNAQPGVLI